MKLAIMQPYLFPYIGYFQLLHAADKFVIYDDVNFIKKGWINRNNIIINGQKSTFTVPLQKLSQNRLIKDIEISADSRWRNKFLQSILFNYKKADYFEETYNLIQNVINSDETYISRLILQSLLLFKEKLVLDVSLVTSSEVYNNRELSGQTRILDICKQESAEAYINPYGGKELYDRALFMKKNIKLAFLKSNPISYQQFKNSFVPHLSIIDVLMFNGFAKTRKFLSEYVLS